ncbi:universal stress protein [Catenulispora yoronensis]|uniref:Universal stress protein n=1 Tax=Catenulispora yoronensis TaxID=450799 RepID=A0ABP5G1F2_9ACTN
MTGPVVVGIDDFEHSDHLIAAAAQEAGTRLSRTLWLAHAYHGFAPPAQETGLTPEETVRAAALAHLAALAEQVQLRHPELRVETAAVTGPPAPALAKLAGSAALLVVGGRGRGGLAGQLLGSVSLRVLARADCPVLVVRGDQDEPAGRVMVGVDIDDLNGSATGPEVLEFAFDEAQRRDADLYAFYAWEDPSVLYAYGSQVFMNEQREAALERGRERLAAALYPWQQLCPEVKVASEVLAGLPAKLLVEATRMADVVVIGGRVRRDDQEGMRVGAIAHTVLHHAACPVAIVPEH